MSAYQRTDSRLYFLDWLRILALAGLVVYHVGMYYVSWDFHVKSPFAEPGLEPWMKLTGPWRMSLLFLVSGAATSFMLKGGPSFLFLGRRSAFLLLPLLTGVVFIVPPQSYFEVVQKYDYSGGYFEFLALYFSGYSGFCGGSGCLVLPTWNHLWFLPYLWVYTVLTCGILKVWPAGLQWTSRLFEKALRGTGLFLIPILFIACARLVLVEQFPSTHALVGDWFNQIIYAGMFTCGAVFATSPVMWNRLACARWPALGTALAFWVLLVLVNPAKPFLHGVVAVYQWTALVAAIGFVKVHLDRDGPLRRRLTQAVFPVYILHQTVIVVSSQVLLPFHWRPVVEGPLIILLTFAVSYVGYALLRRFECLRPWLGLKP
jgi:glucans biosynthesis protein C